jgi:flagellar hook-basal body complex protein FliE
MIAQIAGFGLTEAIQQGGASKAAAEGGGGKFADALERAIDHTNTEVKGADAMVEAMAAGKPVGLHETMIAVERADVAVRTAVAVKSRAVEAYQEIMRMQM